MNLSVKCLTSEGIMPTHQEEFELFDKKLVYRPCKENVNDNCEKYLLRFEEIDLFANELKNFLKENQT